MTNFIAIIAYTCCDCYQQHAESNIFDNEAAMTFYTYGVVSHLKDIGNNIDLITIDISRDGGGTFTNKTEIAMVGMGFKKMPDIRVKSVKEVFDDIDNAITKFFDSLQS